MDPTPPADCCPLVSVCQEFDFDVSDGGFSILNCGGASVWEWGESDQDPDVDCDDEAVTNVLGTVLNSTTYEYSGEAAVIGPVAITADCTCMELCHYYHMEGFYDGGNVKVSTDGGTTWDLVIPASFYDAQDEFMCLDTKCIRGELAYSDEHQAMEYKSDCFDLSEFVGQSVLVGFFFGSDETWTGLFAHQATSGGRRRVPASRPDPLLPVRPGPQCSRLL